MSTIDLQDLVTESIGSDLAPPSDLPIVSLEERHRRTAREARRDIAMQRWLTACPPILRECDPAFPDLAPVRPQIERILSWERGPRGLLATGDTGAGKTRAMFALMRRFCEAGEDVHMWSSVDWFGRLQQSVSYGRDDAQSFVEFMGSVPILFIDDWGQEALVASRETWARQWWFRLLDIRYGAGRPMFLTTNLRRSDLAIKTGMRPVYEDPLVRRLTALMAPVIFWPEDAS